ncbi:hypothetical protein [Microbacterium suwonense]|uniref:Uncharacterized protein n=1 Tax=Microbacterium suwonense TaxID=683047 RepID=A0ABM8FTA5_9MICO|nr:hypothetical protein [Microbacterium suwonense]BDZ38912.1 hypothetical protein GCM10025863_15260 [Microbacterium suwonense]
MSDPIDADPFWSVVRRRHPNLDIALLPPTPPAPTLSGLPPRSPEPFARSHLADSDAVWARLVGHGMPQTATRWIPGPTRDSVRHLVTLTLDGVDSALGLGHLRGTADLLVTDGWRVFTPPTGMPRVTADHDGELGDEHLLIGYAPETRRLFLRLTSTGLPVDERRAQELIGGTV